MGAKTSVVFIILSSVYILNYSYELGLDDRAKIHIMIYLHFGQYNII